jgi:DNA/RNA-binding domain of Phe-tRNA-synthetase-like protein
MLERDSDDGIRRRAMVRDMLRHGTYKPTGRGKPASEYLLAAAVESAFPYINNLVDINNLVSIETRLPISMIDLTKAGFRDFVVRWGREGETYVFNPSGQVLDLRDLLLLARLPADLPCGTPVKDAQETKTDAGTVEALGVVYAPAALAEVASAAARRMADLIRRFAGGEADAGSLP